MHPSLAAECLPGSPVAEPLLTAERLLDEFHDSVFRYAYRLSGDASAADDISQEAFVRAMRSLHQLRDPQAALGWLLAITRNEFARWCRKFGRQSTVQLDEVWQVADATDYEVLDRAEWVQVALRQLPDDFRVIISMYYFEQLSYTEIAAELAIPLGTVMSRLNRGKLHLKQALRNLAEPNVL